MDAVECRDRNTRAVPTAEQLLTLLRRHELKMADFGIRPGYGILQQRLQMPDHPLNSPGLEEFSGIFQKSGKAVACFYEIQEQIEFRYAAIRIGRRQRQTRQRLGGNWHILER